MLTCLGRPRRLLRGAALGLVLTSPWAHVGIHEVVREAAANADATPTIPTRICSTRARTG